MLWFPTKKEVKKEFIKIKNSFKKRDSKILALEKNLNDLKKEIELIYKLREPTPRTLERTPQTAIRRKANKILNKVEIMQEINSLLKKGLSTTEIYEIIVNQKALIKKTCFFKYIKVVREQSARTLRTTLTN